MKGGRRREEGEGIQEEGRDLALGGWWAPTVRYIFTDEQVQVTQFPLTPSAAPRVRAKADLSRHRRR